MHELFVSHSTPGDCALACELEREKTVDDSLNKMVCGLGFGVLSSLGPTANGGIFTPPAKIEFFAHFVSSHLPGT